MNGGVKSFAKWALRLLLLVVLAVASLLVYLDIHGFPPALVNLVAKQFAQAGYRMQVSSIHFDWSRGVVASDMVLADAKTPTEPIGRVDEVQLKFDLRRLWQDRNAIRALRIANANLSIPLAADGKSATQFTTQGAFATLRFDEDGTIRIEQLVGVYCGINLGVRGSIKPSKATTSPEDQRERLRGRFAFVAKALHELNSLQAAEPPQLDVDFNLDLARPWAGRVAVKLEGQKVQYRGLDVDSIWVHLEMREAAINITACELTAGGGALSISGQYDVGQGQFDLKLASTIHPSVLAPLLPEKAAAIMREVRVGQRPKLTARYLLSPATGTQPKLTGTVELGDLELRGTQFRSIYAQVENVGQELFIRDALIIMADGRLAGHGQYNLKTTGFTYELESTLNPGKLLVFMPPGVRDFVAPSWFEKSPHIKANVTGDFVDPEKFAYDADVATKNGSYRGVAFGSASAKLQLRRNKLEVRDIVFAREDGDVQGQVMIDFPRQQVQFDVRTSANPVPLAAMLGPKAAEFATPYRFGPYTRGTAVGMADFHDASATAWSAEFTNRQVRAWDIVADQTHARLWFTNNVLHIIAKAGKVEYPSLHADRVWADFQITTNNIRGTADALGVGAWGLTAGHATGSFAYVYADSRLSLDAKAEQIKGYSLTAATGSAQVVAFSNVVQAAVQTTDFGWWRLKAATATGDILISNQNLAVNNFAGALYDGKIRGFALFDGSADSQKYEINLWVERSSIESLLDGIREKPGRRMTGFLTGDLQLQGAGADLADLRGTGRLAITDGVIWRAAIFGPFSHILGDTKATDARCSFTIGDRLLKTDDIEVAAGAFTAKSRGTVDFNGKLDFRVQAQFLRSWPGINLITVLLGKVLEYKVGGTLADPNYRAVNLPKELLPHD